MKTFTLTLAFLLSFHFAQAQRTICGTVTDKSTGEALIGVSILVEGTTIGTVTDIDGKYCIEVSVDSKTLVFQYIGFKEKKVTIDDKKTIDIALEESLEMLESVVVTSFGKRKLFKKSRKMSAPATSAPVSIKGYTSPMKETATDFYMDGISVADKKGGKSAPGNSRIKAGMLTAGEVNDFSKWDLWQDITKDQLLHWQRHWKIAPLDRYTLQLMTENGSPIIDAEAQLLDRDGNTVWAARTDNTGKAELWANLFEKGEKEQAYTISVSYNGQMQLVANPNTFHNGINVVKMAADCTPPKQLDVMWVVDATGSMGDEIEYLKTELLDVMERAQDNQKDLNIRMGSVFYRDKGDEYIVRTSPFSNKMEKTIDFIKNQYAMGGGDTPEAVDTAIYVALNEFKWSEEAVARILFLVLDASPHYRPEVLTRLQELTTLAAKMGIRIVPVSGSGISKGTEYLTRSMALATNGTYTFLTDHSGIGNPHIEPTTDDYEVEMLNDLLVRLIDQFTQSPDCETTPQLAKKTFKEKIDEDLQAFLKMYPNPTQGPLTLELDKKVEALYVADLSGKILQRWTQLPRGKTEIHLGDYPSGVYFIRYPASEDKWLSGKVVLVH